MQVTNVKDHVTHAVIGANEAHSFGIADTAAFFRVLSSSLYSNKPLAVVREILCNAWDAHVEGGVDRPVEVSLNREKLVIRDFGSGLSPEQIIKNYTTYGGTTKLDNEEVTGGFGLGSKAPFAYVDHFEVISFHQGTKTIYNMSLSSALVDGKPTVMKLLDIPCGDETGIQVTVKLRDWTDENVFRNLVHRIAMFGEMNVSLNGDKVETLPFSEAEHGFLILDKIAMPMASDARVWVRYGHVVYPLEKHNDFRGEYDSAKEFLRSINGSSYYGNDINWVLVLQAAPGKVSITPSRESLSLTDHTIDNCRQLLADFCEVTSNGIDAQCQKIIEQAIKASWDKKLVQERTVPGDLLSYNPTLPSPGYFNKLTKLSIIRNLDDAATHYLCRRNYPKSKNFLTIDMDMRLDQLTRTKTLDQKLVNSFYRAVARERRRGKGYGARNPWIYRKMVWPLLKALQEHKTLKPASLMAYCSEKYGNDHKPRSIKEMQAVVQDLSDQLPYLRKVVILSYNRIDILDRAHKFPIMKDFLGSPKNSFCYIVPRHAGRVAEAKELFTKLGYRIVDLTTRQKWEPEVVKEKTSLAPSAPRRKGLCKASNLLIHEGTKLSLREAFQIGKPTLEKPEMVVQLSPQLQSLEKFGPFNSNAMLPVVRQFGDRIGMAANSAQLVRYVKEGANSAIEKVIIDEILNEFQTNSKIEQHYRNYRAGDFAWHIDNLLKAIRQDDILRSQFKLPEPLKDKALDFVAIYENYPHWEQERNPQLKEISKLVKSWSASPELAAVTAKLVDNPLVHLVDTSDIQRYIVMGSPEKAALARKMLALVMKG
jgi:hypothetical protein